MTAKTVREILFELCENTVKQLDGISNLTIALEQIREAMPSVEEIMKVQFDECDKDKNCVGCWKNAAVCEKQATAIRELMISKLQ